MKSPIAIILALTLAACGGGSSGTDLTSSPTVDFVNGNETARIDRTDEYNVDIPSMGNAVGIAAHNTVTLVRITGSNNALTVEDSVLIRTLDISGANDTVSLGNAVSVPALDIVGSNAIVSIGAHDQVDRLFVSGSNAVVTIRDISASVPAIVLTGSNATLRVPPGFMAASVLTDEGSNNKVVEQ
jgi:hypothetical protein